MAGFNYIPHTDADVRAMLERIGVRQVEDLYADVPKEFIRNRTTFLMPCPRAKSVSGLSRSPG